MYADFTYEEATQKAAALRELGAGDIYLSRGDYPWHLANNLEPGGTHRIDMATSVLFYADDPSTGLKFRWSFDIEPREANGSGEYQPDTDKCRKVMKLMPEATRAKFREYLLGCADQVAEQGLKYQQAADRQARYAAILRDIARTE